MAIEVTLLPRSMIRFSWSARIVTSVNYSSDFHTIPQNIQSLRLMGFKWIYSFLQNIN